MKTESKKKFIQSVGRALYILEHIAQNENTSRLVDISNSLDLNKSTVHSLISTLEQMGYVNQDEENGRYSLGVKLFELGKIYEENMNLNKIAMPFLVELRDKYCETVHMAIESEGEVVYISKVDSPYSLTMTSKVGGRNLMHCTGVGKVLLAYMDEYKVEEIIESKGLKKVTKHTITDRDKLLEELNKIKEQGYGFDLQEIEVGLNCVAVPVKNHKGNVIAAISISAPMGRVSKEEVINMKSEIIETANQISRALGY